MAPLLIFTGLTVIATASDTIKFGYLPLYMEQDLRLAPAVLGAVIGIQPLVEFTLIRSRVDWPTGTGRSGVSGRDRARGCRLTTIGPMCPFCRTGLLVSAKPPWATLAHPRR